MIDTAGKFLLLFPTPLLLLIFERLIHTFSHAPSLPTTPEFSKDGKSMIFASHRNGKFSLYMVNLE